MDYYKTPKLILSDYEKGYLTAFYEGYLEMQEYKCPNCTWFVIGTLIYVCTLI
jgi:hypothetical protein